VLKSRRTMVCACAGVMHPSGAVLKKAVRRLSHWSSRTPVAASRVTGHMPLCEMRNFVGAGRNENQSSSESNMPIVFVLGDARVEMTRGSSPLFGVGNQAGVSPVDGTSSPVCRKRSVLTGDDAPGCGFIHPGATLEVWNVSERLERSPAAGLFWSMLRTPSKTLPVARRRSARCCCLRRRNSRISLLAASTGSVFAVWQAKRIALDMGEVESLQRPQRHRAANRGAQAGGAVATGACRRPKATRRNILRRHAAPRSEHAPFLLLHAQLVFQVPVHFFCVEVIGARGVHDCRVPHHGTSLWGVLRSSLTPSSLCSFVDNF
jgi:hypothetical protein